jgi:site-specific DNA-adenine methylase
MYRIPYQGSKQAIIKKIYDIINNDLNNRNDLFTQDNKKIKIYDLFCGGGSVGYYFYTKGFEVVMNDIHKPLMDLHRKLQEGIDKDLLYKWISREEFIELKERQDWYGELIRICWSFGNNKRDYLFGKDVEDYKKQGHFIVVNKCKEAGRKWFEMIGKSDDWNIFSKVYEIETQKERRLFLRRYIKDNTRNKKFGKHNDLYLYCTQEEYAIIKDMPIVERCKFLNENQLKNDRGLAQLQQLERLEQLQQLQQLQRFERLQQLEQLEQLQQLQRFEHNITFVCKNYWEFEFEPNSIIYCDPPYINTAGYNGEDFDFERFDNWVETMRQRGVKVYISEYTNHNNAWREVGSISKYILMSNYLKEKVKKQEKIFCNI